LLLSASTTGLGHGRRPAAAAAGENDDDDDDDNWDSPDSFQD